jgi:hypothetical protein
MATSSGISPGINNKVSVAICGLYFTTQILDHFHRYCPHHLWDINFQNSIQLPY